MTTSSDKYSQLAHAISDLNEFEWDMVKGKIDYLFNQKASKLQLGSQEIEKQLRQTIKIHR